MESKSSEDTNLLNTLKTLIASTTPQDVAKAEEYITGKIGAELAGGKAMTADEYDHMIKTMKDDDGRSILHYACAVGNLPIARLLRQKCDINQQDEAKWTALHSAAAAGHVNIVTLLLEHSQDDVVTPCSLNNQTETGGTPLHYAASKVQAGADLDIRDHNGHTALMKAVCTNKEDVVDYLIQKGASLTNNKNLDIGAIIYKAAPSLACTPNKEGKCPADLASRGELLEWKRIKDGESQDLEEDS